MANPSELRRADKVCHFGHFDFKRVERRLYNNAVNSVILLKSKRMGGIATFESKYTKL